MPTTTTGCKDPSTFTEDFQSTEFAALFANDTVKLAFMDVTGLTRLVNITIDPPRYGHRKALILCPNASAQIEFHFPVRRVRFNYTIEGGLPCRFTFYDADRKPLMTEYTQPPGFIDAWMEFSRDTAEIKSIEFLDHGSRTKVKEITVET